MGFFKDCGCGCDGQKAQEQFTISVISGLTFFLVANPQMYMLMRNLIGSRVASVNGNPTMFGLTLHAIVFTLVVWMMMQINKKERYEPSPGPSEEGPSEEKKKGPLTPAEIAAKKKAILAKRKAKAVVKEEGPAEEGPAEEGPAEEGPAEAEGPAPVNGITGFELDGFDLQAADFDGPAPKKAMVCNCPDGSTVTVN